MLDKLNFFELPGRLVHGHSRFDQFTLQEAFHAATTLQATCIRVKREVGWQPIGQSLLDARFLDQDTQVLGLSRFE